MDLQQFLEELKDIDFTALDREQQEEGHHGAQQRPFAKETYRNQGLP